MKTQKIVMANNSDVGVRYRKFSISDKVFPSLKKRILDHKVEDEITFTVTGKVVTIGEETYWDKNAEKTMLILDVKISKIKL